jgi:Icc protein
MALRLLHITDTHLHSDPDARLRGVNTVSSLRSVLAEAAGNSHQPDLIVATGDLSQDETAGAYRNFRNILAPLGVPVWCVPGNHDAPPLMNGPLEAPPCHLGGVAVQPPWCLVMLDSFVAGDHGGSLSAAALDHLRETLREHRELHALIAVHHHPLPVGSRWLDALGLRNSAAFFDVLDDAPNVRVVLSGHVHQEADLNRGGVRFLSTPSTCFQFMPNRERFAVDTRPPGCRWLDLMDSGSIATEVIWVPQE